MSRRTAGFLVSEGVVRSAADIETIKIRPADRCDHADHEGAGNVADVTLRPGLTVDPALRRNFLATSACRVCGKASMGAIRSAGF